MEVLQEGVGGAWGDVGADYSVDLVDVLDGVGVYPDHWDYVEEDSALAEEADVREDCCVDLGEEVLDDGVIGLEGFRITLAQISVDRLEEVEGIVDDFIVSTAEVPDADIDDILQEVLKGRIG